MTVIDFGALMKEAGDGFGAVPEGPYHIEIAKSEATTSSNNNPMIKVQLRIIGGPHAGRLLFDQHVLAAGSPNSLKIFFEKMAALGLSTEFFLANPPFETVASSLMGKQALVTVSIKTEGQYAGRNEVTKYAPPPMGQMGGAMPTTNVINFPQAPAARASASRRSTARRRRPRWASRAGSRQKSVATA